MGTMKRRTDKCYTAATLCTRTNAFFVLVAAGLIAAVVMMTRDTSDVNTNHQSEASSDLMEYISIASSLSKDVEDYTNHLKKYVREHTFIEVSPFFSYIETHLSFLTSLFFAVHAHHPKAQTRC